MHWGNISDLTSFGHCALWKQNSSCRDLVRVYGILKLFDSGVWKHTVQANSIKTANESCYTTCCFAWSYHITMKSSTTWSEETCPKNYLSKAFKKICFSITDYFSGQKTLLETEIYIKPPDIDTIWIHFKLELESHF